MEQRSEQRLRMHAVEFITITETYSDISNILYNNI